MKTLISLVSIFLLLQVSSANAQPVLDRFLQCLPDHINKSNPISQFVFTQNSSLFQHVLVSYAKNRRFLTPDTPKPLAIIAANHVSHVQATIVCAKTNGLQIRIRSGGHDYEGLSYVSNVTFAILDMFNLRSIDIDVTNETAWVQSGATLGELYYKISNTSKTLAFPAGVCPTVGIGGHFSGGGYGNLMRKFGLSVDNIVDALLVDVNGKILNRVSMGEDLFWAIRGGGGSSFGVILSWKIKLVQVPEKVTVFRISKTLQENATDVVYKWQQVAYNLPEDVFIRVMPTVANSTSDQKTVLVYFIGLVLGKSDEIVSLMNQDFPELGLEKKDCYEISWIESVLFWAEFPFGTSRNVLLDRPTNVKFFSKGKSDFVKNVIPKSVLELLWKKMIILEKMWMQFNPYGGKMSEISESEVPFPHRKGNLFKIQYSANWVEDGVDVTNHYVNGLRDFYGFMASYVSNGPREAFMNYRDLDIGGSLGNETRFEDAKVYGSKYFKGNFVRLVDVKGKVDPDNFFKHEQSIPPPPPS